MRSRGSGCFGVVVFVLRIPLESDVLLLSISLFCPIAMGAALGYSSRSDTVPRRRARIRRTGEHRAQLVHQGHCRCTWPGRTAVWVKIMHKRELGFQPGTSTNTELLRPQDEYSGEWKILYYEFPRNHSRGLLKPRTSSWQRNKDMRKRSLDFIRPRAITPRG